MLFNKSIHVKKTKSVMKKIGAGRLY